MCGIWCALSTRQPVWPSPETLRLLERRGPDSSSGCAAAIDWQTDTLQVAFHATVLSLRGQSTVEQPYRSGALGSILCWNGEAWKIAGQPPILDNDTAAVSQLLDGVELSPNEQVCRSEAVAGYAAKMAKTLSQIAGPYALVYYDPANRILFFGRDFLGRRSLLTRVTADGELQISSVAAAEDTGRAIVWSEVEADGLHYVDLMSYETGFGPDDAIKSRVMTQKVPYHFMDADEDAALSVIPLLSLNRDISSLGLRLSSAAPAVQRLEALLRSALHRRLATIRPDSSSTSSLAVLFSGGLDCTVLTRLSHDIHPSHESIDLLNVAFENPRAHKEQIAAGTDPYERCPDRITGRASHAELMRVCPGRRWIFVAINVPYSETMAHKERVVELMQPHNTEMDLSIACALYFAARGSGISSLSSDRPAEPATTSARVLLSGLGADEVFGGYQRHATAFSRNRFDGLLDELDLDIGRLGKRNLGRDDRVISDWGREARFPFLDEGLLAWALAAPVYEKCGFGEEMSKAQDGMDGSELLEPGKKVLRCLAWKL
ncbi:hypothetical protein LTR53_009127, partial [Teratosphaeriaceae sp. CCFEE 6253]